MAREISQMLSTLDENADTAKLTEKFISTMKKLRKTSEASIEKEKENPQSFEDDDMQSQLQIEDAGEVDRALIAERNADFRVLEEELGELVDTFAECRELLGEQGEQLDVIESNVDTADIYVEEATGDLEEAFEISKAVTKKKICICATLTIICLAVLIALAIVIYTQTK
eukprot:TRINITY_DN688_c0_g1_i1.p1 TRINITY_DN688_c0_g1~~TRINITY_DN688_c0_g1_i1.p1  ORF type:complete len:170 (-),score=37.66 TRINITY_DN688_c0_g1_i1:47-556(-)